MMTDRKRISRNWKIFGYQYRKSISVWQIIEPISHATFDHNSTKSMTQNVYLP